jgi:hypothetical protein
MKKITGKLLLFVLLSCFMAGTTGFSYFIHECNSSHKKEITVFPEFVNEPATCCCSDEVPAGPDPFPAFSEPRCCTSTYVYLKASFNGFPVFFDFSKDLLSNCLYPDIQRPDQNDPAEFTSANFTRIDHPPPRSGRLLIQFIQQIKIPVSVS